MQESLREWDLNSDVLLALFGLQIDNRRNKEAKGLLDRWGNKVIDRLKYQMRIDFAEAEGDFAEAIRVQREWDALAGTNSDSHVLYLLICLKSYSEAEKLARQILEPVNYCVDAIAEIVNLELARKALGKKVDHRRLEGALGFAGEKISEAAIFALLDRKDDALNAMRDAIRKDKTEKFTVRRWPVFEGYQTDREVMRLIEK